MNNARICVSPFACLLVPVLAGAQGADARPAPGSPTADHLPIYEIDPTWPPTLPNDWILGDIGEPGVNSCSNDPHHLGGPANFANFYVDPKTNELFVADGYINKRVVVYDAATGSYRRHWGAYGKPRVQAAPRAACLMPIIENRETTPGTSRVSAPGIITRSDCR